MSTIVQEACVNCKYGDCVEVCPVNAFYEGPDMLYINPAECIDCEACIPECPVDAIRNGSDAEQVWIYKNANFTGYTEENRRTTKDSVTHGPNWKG